MDFSSLLCSFIGSIQDVLDVMLTVVNNVLGVFDLGTISIDLASLIGLTCD